MDALLWALLIFVLRMANVCLSTIRTLMVVRRQRVEAALVGFFKTMFLVVAVGKVVQDIGNVWNLMGYCAGFATGTLLGMTIDERLALGLVVMRIISLKKGREIALSLREKGYGATEMLGEGRAGKVRIIDIVAKRKDIPSITTVAVGIDGDAFITVEEARDVHGGYIPRMR